MTMEGKTPSLSLFYCYARKDQALRDELDAHLTALRRSGRITMWYDGELVPGTLWEQAIEQQLNKADIILLLISPDFIQSEYCYGKEMMSAIDRHKAGTASVVPILLRPVDFTDAPFAVLHMLPSNARAVTSSKWFNRDEALEDVARGLRRTISELLKKRAASIPQSPPQKIPIYNEKEVNSQFSIAPNDVFGEKESKVLQSTVFGANALIPNEAEKKPEDAKSISEDEQNAVEQIFSKNAQPSIEVEHELNGGRSPVPVDVTNSTTTSQLEEELIRSQVRDISDDKPPVWNLTEEIANGKRSRTQLFDSPLLKVGVIPYEKRQVALHFSFNPLWIIVPLLLIIGGGIWLLVINVSQFNFASVWWWLLEGLVIGFLASIVMRGGGYGCVGDLILGILGSLLGGILASLFGSIGGNMNNAVWAIIMAFVGACIFIGILRWVSGSGRTV